MFSKFVGVLRTFGGRIMVGKDKNGNSYYRKPEKVGVVPEKRWMEFKGAPDPTTIPVEWSSWLSGTRKEAPTPQVLISRESFAFESVALEIINLEAQRRNIKLQAELLQKKEAKERFRARVSQHAHYAVDELKQLWCNMTCVTKEGSKENMEIIMRQIGSEESGSSQPGRAKAEEPAHARYTKVRDVEGSAEPTTWQPPRQESRATSWTSRPSNDSSTVGSTVPQGEGEKSKPDTWNP